MTSVPRFLSTARSSGAVLRSTAIAADVAAKGHLTWPKALLKKRILALISGSAMENIGKLGYSERNVVFISEHLMLMFMGGW